MFPEKPFFDRKTRRFQHNSSIGLVVCDVVYAVAYRAYAIRLHIYHLQSKNNTHRLYSFRKTIIACPFSNIPKTTSDVRKTMSYVGKITSDIIQTTSDLFLPLCNTL